MTNFLLNQEEIQTSLPPGTTLLDFIRYQKHLTGTKIGCREGDCGACTVLLADFEGDSLKFRNVTSCLTALGNVCGKQVITVEGLNLPEGLNLVQSAMEENSASQCGFCTPGFVVSLSGYCINGAGENQEDAVDAIAGNICRCTGYKSIEKAAIEVHDLIKNLPEEDGLKTLVKEGLMPDWLLKIPDNLSQLKSKISQAENQAGQHLLSGGTDLYVQKHEEIVYAGIRFLQQESGLKKLDFVNGFAHIGGGTTVSILLEWPVFKSHFPDWRSLEKLVSSAPIRNIASIAGNFVNASPIGDLSIFFLGLGAELTLDNGTNTRKIALRDFFISYKKTALEYGEWISSIQFRLPAEGEKIHFEKVCKRTNLDIASVNSALFLKVKNNEILEAGLAAGGVGPIPQYLKASSEFLTNKIPNIETLTELLKLVDSEISPMSDVRGSEAYKRLLLAQQIRAHFLAHFPEFNFQQVKEAGR